MPTRSPLGFGVPFYPLQQVLAQLVGHSTLKGRRRAEDAKQPYLASKVMAILYAHHRLQCFSAVENGYTNLLILAQLEFGRTWGLYPKSGVLREDL